MIITEVRELRNLSGSAFSKESDIKCLTQNSLSANFLRHKKGSREVIQECRIDTWLLFYANIDICHKDTVKDWKAALIKASMASWQKGCLQTCA